ncbi:MAG: cyclic nucleotide-gated ion channel, partial [Pseudomonadota bacterium]
ERPTLRRRVHLLLDGRDRRPAGRTVLDIAIAALILAAVGSAILSTEQTIAAGARDLFLTAEYVFAGLFAVEYLLRLWSTAETARPGDGPWRRRWAFIRSPMGIIDLLAIAPVFLQPVLGFDLLALRLLRLFRIFKLTRASPAMETLGAVLVEERRTLAAAFLLLCTVSVLAAAGMHALEAHAQPEAFGSIPRAMWWSIVTATTVGYGDVTPITPAGKALAAVMALIGVALFALPATILANAFLREIRRRDFIANIRVIAASPVIQQLDAVGAAQLATNLEQRQYAPGETIIAAGAASTGLFFLGHGQVECEAAGEKTLYDDGDFFGAGALMADRAVGFTATALAPTTLLRLPPEDFRRLCRLLPTFREAMAEAAAADGADPADFQL